MLALTQWQMAGRSDLSSSQALLSDKERSQQSLVVIKQSIQSSSEPDPQTAATTIQPLEPKSETKEKTDSRIVVSLSERQVQLYQGDQLLNSYAIAVAKPGWETPTGTFQVLDMEQNPDWVHPITGITVPPGNDNPLGAAWIGFLGGALGAGVAVALGTLLNPWITETIDLGEGNSLLIFEAAPIVGLILGLMLVAVVAGILPARKAGKLDPVEALRTE